MARSGGPWEPAAGRSSWRAWRPSLAGQFMLYSLVILVAGAVLIGSLAAVGIKQGVINRTMAVTALFVDSFVTPHLQDLTSNGVLPTHHVEDLDTLLGSTPLGKRIVSFKVWSTAGQVVYAIDRRLIGQRFPIGPGLQGALDGDVRSHLSRLTGAENRYERERWDTLVETYAPVHHYGDGRVIGVAEFYQLPDELLVEVAGAQRRVWGVVSAATLAMFAVLNGMVRRASTTIVSQNRNLRETVGELTSLQAIIDASITSLSVDRSLAVLLQRLVTAVGASAGAIFRLDSNGHLQPGASVGLPADHLQAAAGALSDWTERFPAETGIQSWHRGDSGERDPVLAALSWPAALVAPLAARGQLLGVVLVGEGAGGANPAAVRLVSAVCERAALFLHNTALVERLQAVAAQKTQTDERVLQRIAFDLHDGPAQDVSLALLRIDTLHRRLGPVAADEAANRDFALLQAALANALREIRQISAGLRLPELSGLTLAEVAQKACEDHRSTTDSQVELSVQRLPPDTGVPLKIAVYRIIQEGLRNASRHGGVGEQAVRLATDRGTLSIAVHDNGVGFDPAALAPEAGPTRLGLRGMQERVEIMGGRFVVTSAPGRGTLVQAFLPLSGRGEAE